MVTDSTGELQQRVIGFIAENGPQLGKELALALPDVPVLALWQACYRSEAFHMSHFASYYLRFDVTRDDQVRLSPSILRDFMSFTLFGLPGQRVCRAGRAISVNGVPLGEARDHDSLGRDLPVWLGCRVIAEGEVFLMNPDVGDSLDGRYFGPLPASAVIGHAIPLFTDEDGDGRFVWRAPMR